MWRRPWVIFGISAFVIAVATTCIFGNALVRVQRQHAILMEINARGGGYEYAPNDDWGIPFAWQVPRSVQLRVNASAVDLTAILALASELKDIQTLEITNASSLSTVQLQSIGAMRSLKGLDLAGAQIGDAELHELAGLSELETFNLERTNITSTSLPKFSKYSKLKLLGLRETSMEYQLVFDWAQAHPQCVVAWRPRLTLEQEALLQQISDADVHLSHIDEPPKVEAGWSWSVGLRDHPRVWQQLRQLGGVHHVTMGGAHYVDWDLQQLTTIPSVRTLQIMGASATPDGLQSLSTLRLTDLVVTGVDVSENDLLALRTSLPQLQIHYGFRQNSQQHPGPLYPRHRRPFLSMQRPRPYESLLATVMKSRDI